MLSEIKKAQKGSYVNSFKQGLSAQLQRENRSRTALYKTKARKPAPPTSHWSL